MRLAWLALATALVACAGGVEPAATAPRADKPHAAADPRLHVEALGAGRQQVELEVEALATLGSLELVVLDPSGRVLGASAARPAAEGERRVLSLETAAGPVIGAAVTPDGSRAVAWTPAGAAAKPAPARVVATPFGPVAEVAE